MVDPYLRDFVAAAEQDKSLPLIRVVAGNTLFVGTPGSSRAIWNAWEKGLEKDHYSALPTIPMWKPDTRPAEAKTYAEEVIAQWSAVIGTETGEVLTLVDCQVWPASGGDGVEVAVARIPLSAIDGWWLGTGRRLKAAREGGWLFGLGAIVPTDGA